jgi:hypothetical protein
MIFNLIHITMKKILILFALASLTWTTFAQQQFASTTGVTSDVSKAMALFDWSETTFDFGKIAVSKPATHEFTFINRGVAPLLISSVQASCGCTVAEFSKDPIPPGSAGFVRATYNALRIGIFTKTITINANTDIGVVRLVVTGEVVD